MTRLLILTATELTRDPRARRQAVAALARGIDVVGLSGGAHEARAPLDGVSVVRVRTERVSAVLRRTGLSGMKPSHPVVRELRGLVRVLRLALTTVRLARAARRLGHFDVVHANDFSTLPTGWLLARRVHARLIYDAHELYVSQEADAPRTYRKIITLLEGPLARRAESVVTVSEPLGVELRRRLRLSRDPILVLNCPPSSPDRPKRPLAGRTPRAVYQGALGPDRPISALLNAVEHAPHSDLTIRVVAIGVDELSAEIARRGLAGRVRAVEPVRPDRLVEALCEFDIGVIFNRGVTRQHRYAMPNRLFEYMMAGLAIVAPRMPAMTPLIEGERIGITYPPGDQPALGAALDELSRDPARVEELGARARRLAVERFNAEAEAERLSRAWLPAGLARTAPEHAPA